VEDNKGRPESSISIKMDHMGQESALRDVPSKTKQSIEDEEYSIPQESGYSQEDFEEDNKSSPDRRAPTAKTETHPIQCVDDQG